MTTPSPGTFCSCHAEIAAAVLDEHVPFLEGIGIEQQFDALAGGQPALGVLGIDPALPAAGARRGALLFQLLQDFLHPLLSLIWRTGYDRRRY